MSFVPSDTPPPPYSDDDLAQRFSERHAEDLRFVHRWGQWLAWDGQRWRRDDTLYAFDRARVVARDAAAEAITDRRGKSPTGIASAKTVAAIDRLCVGRPQTCLGARRVGCRSVAPQYPRRHR